MAKRAYCFLILFCTLVSPTFANVFPTRPSPARWVNNLSVEMPDFLSVTQADSLENKLSAFANETSNQIVIVIVDDLGGLEPFDYATQLGTEWGVGQADLDNGIIILIKPTGGEGQRNLFIAVGYGLEGAIPDLTTKKIRENEMYPYFKTGDYYTALDKATDVLMALAKGEYNYSAYSDEKNAASSWWEKEYNVFGQQVPGQAFLFFGIFGIFVSVFLFLFIRSFYILIKTFRAKWIADKSPKVTVREFFENPFIAYNRRFSWLLMLIFFGLVISRYGILVIVAAVIIAKKRKMPGSDSFF